jgi:hypothetical protein
MAIAQIDEAIYSALTGNATLTGLVSTRIYPLVLPQECDLPAVTFFRVSNLHNHGMGGDVTLMETRLQISSLADSVSMMRTVSDAVRGVLSRWRGTYESVVVQDSLLDSEMDDFEPETEVYQCIQDYIIYHD